MALDANEKTVVNALEHKVRHALGLYEGLARHLLNVIPDSEGELREFVSLHAERTPELCKIIEDLFKRLAAARNINTDGDSWSPSGGGLCGSDSASGGG